MDSKEIFEYAVIRYVPHVHREEFLNVGVIVFSKRKKALLNKFEINKERILAFAPHTDLEELQSHLESWHKISQATSDSGPIGLLDQGLRFRWLTATRSTIIQSSKPHPGLSANPQKTLDCLFDKYVNIPVYGK